MLMVEYAVKFKENAIKLNYIKSPTLQILDYQEIKI